MERIITEWRTMILTKRKFWLILAIVILLGSFGMSPGAGGGGDDQVDFPAIYIDASVGDGGVGSQADYLS